MFASILLKPNQVGG
jgi:two-component system, NarL family, invasion response regulator UvrY